MSLAPALALVLAAAGPAREALGQFGRWGAFREGGRCVAMAEPVGRGRGTLAVLTGGGIRAQIHASLPAPGPATLRIDGRDFALLVRGRDGWAASVRDDLHILHALRRGVRAEIRASGRTARYALAGFPSAADAALTGCAPLAK